MRGLIDRLMRLARLDSETPPHAEADRSCRSAARPMRRRAAARRPPRDRLQRRRRRTDRWPIAANSAKRSGTSSKTRSSMRRKRRFILRAARNNGHTTITVRDEGPGHDGVRAAARLRALLSRRPARRDRRQRPWSCDRQTRRRTRRRLIAIDSAPGTAPPSRSRSSALQLFSRSQAT